MKIRKRNGRNRNLAILLVCLLVLGASPYHGMGISYAENEEENAGTTEETEDEVDDELTEGTDDGTDDGTDSVPGDSYKDISSNNGTKIARSWIYNENGNTSGIINKKNKYFYKNNLSLYVQMLDGNGEATEDTYVTEVEFSIDKKIIKKTVNKGKAVLNIPNDIIQEGDNDQYWDGTIEIYSIGKELFRNPTKYEIQIDKTPPILEITLSDEKNTLNTYVRDNCIYYTNNAVLKVTASDPESGVNKLQITNNGKNCKGVKNTLEKATATIKTSNLSGDIHHLVIEATNNVGNISTEVRECYKDTEAPEIIGFKIPENASMDTVADSSGEHDDVYEHFFHDETPIRVYVSDGANGSGVQEIEVYKIDGITGDIKADDRNELRLVTSEIQYDDENECNYVVAIVPDGIKGQIYAKAKDFLGNESQNIVYYKGVITESEEMHNNHEHINIQLPDTPYKDDKGQNLYGGNVNVQVTVTDEISGVYSVQQPGKIYNNKENEDNDGFWEIFNKVTNSINPDCNWSIERDANLAVKVWKNFTVSEDRNDITFDVEMSDCAENKSNESKTFSIDKTKPVITVTFDNNEPDPDYPQVYNRPRTATISVKERNFSSSGMSVDITSSTGATPNISGWTTTVDKNNPNNTTNTATVTFSEDGDYTMSVGGYDKVKNKADTVTVDSFTIDQTAPVISVSFDKNNPQGSNCYGEARTATISITEHNFVPERVKITGTVSNADTGTIFPAVSSWSHNGDIHTVTILCEADGDYQFDVECMDQAGNIGQKYSSETYTIDRTMPVIEITGVENFSANNGNVIPIVSITDRNYDADSVSMQLTGRNHGATECKGAFTWQENGQRFTFENFPEESAYDDLYTLHVEAVDLAGNVAADEIIFSVNRFGSVYVFDQELTEMDGHYISREQSVKLQEINVDSLERSTIDIVVDANGTPKELTEGVDYTVQQSGGDTGWYCYDYDIQESVFAGDGRYIVTVYSEDRAGNRNQNTEESKKAEIRFGVDKTAPIVTAINVESNKQYPVEVKQATIAVNDNLVLNDVVIYVDGRESDYTVEGENYTFEIPNADRNQTISIVATDMAGNINNYVIDNVLVSTNLFARWYYNTRLFIASVIIAILLLVCGIGALLLAPGRKSRKPGIAMGILLIPLLMAMYTGMTVHAAEADPIQQKQTSVLQMVVLYTDKDGNEHPVQGGTGFLIGTESASAEYMVTAKEVTSVSKETEQQLIELYEDSEKPSKITYSVKAVVKRDVMIDVQLSAESDEMGFAVWKLSQPLYDRQALILCDEPLTGVSGQTATVLGFPTAPSLTGETVYYSMDEMVTKEGTLIGDGSEENIKYLYHNITPNPGMIGGPILNAEGNVVAINQSRQAQEGYYALQMSELLPVLEALGIPYVTASEVEAQRQAELAAIVHKEDLQQRIQDAEALDGRRYYKKSYTALTAILDEAVRVNESETATQEDVDTALAELNTAMTELKEKPPVWVTLLIALAVIAVAAVLFLIWWKKSKPKREEKRQKKLEEFTVTQAAPEFEEKTVQKEDYRELVKPVSQDLYQTVQTGPRREEEIYGETTVFQQDTEIHAQGAYLIRMRTGERIAITGREFVIGKDPSQTDYCIKGNSAISRVHVVIINTGIGYDVSDKNATNGTYVNNVKIAAFQKASLKPGDILRLADEDFEFKVSVQG